MSGLEFTRPVNHPYAKSSKAHAHFAETPFEHRAYSANCIPFKWTLSKEATERLELLKLELDEAAEDAVHAEMRFSTHWLQVNKNQLVMLDTLFSATQPEGSLCSF